MTLATSKQPIVHILSFLLLTLLVAAMAWGVARESEQFLQRDLITTQTHALELVSTEVRDEVEHIFSDILAFAKSDTIANLLLSGNVTGCGEIAEYAECPGTARARTEQFFVHYLRTKKIYHKMRVLDHHGREMVTVRLKGENTVIGHPKGQAAEQEGWQWLQDKSNRDYFQQTKVLPAGVVYVSPLDFNVENGVVEQPLLPTIRFATPLYDQERLLGVLVLSYNAHHLLSTLRKFTRQVQQLELVDQQGAWIFGGPAGSLLDPARGEVVRYEHHDSQEWSRFHDHPGQGPSWIRNDQGLLVIHPFRPFVGEEDTSLVRGMGQATWTLLARIPLADLKAMIRPEWRKVAAVASLVELAMLGVIVMIYQRTRRRLQAEQDKVRTDEAQKVLHEMQLLAMGGQPLIARIESFLDMLLALPCLSRASGGVVMLQQEEGMEELQVVLRPVRPGAPPPCIGDNTAACACWAELSRAMSSIDPGVTPFCVQGMLRLPVRLQNDLGAILGFYGPDGQPPQTDDPDRLAWLLRNAVQILAEMLSRDRAHSRILTLQWAVEQSPASVIITDTKGKITYVNQKFIAVTGYTLDEVLGKNPNLLQSGQTPDSVYQEMWRDLNAGRTWQGELCNRRKDGSLFWESVLLSPIRNLSGRTIHYLAIKEDITQKKQEMMERQTLERQLRQAQKMEALGHLTGGIAHDFNNILAAIKGFTELAILRFGQDESGKLRYYLNNTLTASDRARDLIAQMMTFSRSQELTIQRVVLQPLVKEVVKLMRATLPASISITMVLEEQDLAIRADPVQVHQTLMNLCVNARDAMAGKGRLDIRIRAEQTGETRLCASCHTPFYTKAMIVVTVRDDGTGIAPENLDRIFQPFFTTKEVGHGTGMGLSVIHGILHALQGHITVESVPGQGTAFHLFFQPDESKSANLAGIPLMQGGDAKLLGQILLVDDETPILAYLKDALEEEGLSVTIWAGSIQALTWFEADPRRIDLVITDQTMPEMTGVEMVTRMHTLRPSLPAILCSGYSRDVNADNAASLGITHMLAKPIDLPVLKQHIREILRLQGKERDRTPLRMDPV